MKNTKNNHTPPIDTEVIWFPEWRHFKIVRISAMYLLFENEVAVYKNASLETVKMELMEFFHFYQKEQSSKADA